MNNLMLPLIALTAFTLSGCRNPGGDSTNKDSADANTNIITNNTRRHIIEPGSYVNLSSGKEVYIIPDSSTGHAIDATTNNPVEFYVNPRTGDTLFKTGIIVNNQIQKIDSNWQFDENKVEISGDEIKLKDGFSKLKVEDDSIYKQEGETVKRKADIITN